MKMLSKRTLERLKKEQDAHPASFWEPMNKEHLIIEYMKAHNITPWDAIVALRKKYLVDNPDWVAS